ncbi:undecaprenyl-diphosphate phosphatase [Turicimonas muris]|uniref:undecaprenyl-diphosphate phosphatase n=1 Tax=Turicimonas muris TaxID=1796652 RepID=UPI0026701E57|nr:undecaprenyl-diphosphate phosphatase [Turicimonas muris]
MDWILYLKAVILGIVEGLTEFLPVSSTGHLIVFGSLLDYTGQEADTFYIAIQAGAIVAVCWYYRERIVRICKGLFTEPAQQKLAWNTIIAFLPAAVIGVMVAKYFKEWLFNPVSVATALVIGGIIILIVERYQDKKSYIPRVATMDDMSWKDALKVGFLQCLAMIPGTSRSGATIIGGLVIGLSRTAATEFSFFLAIPTIFGATVYELWQSRDILSADSLPVISIGFVVSFFSALIVVRWLLHYVARHDFSAFGWYRIFFGGVILVTWMTGLVKW